MLESDLLRDGSAGSKPAAEQFAWLRTTLAGAKAKPYAHRMVFQHHPLYLKSADERDAYGNVPQPRRKELLAMYHAAGVEFVFAGHTHKNIHVKDGRMEMLTTTSAGMGASSKSNPHGVRIVKVYPDRIEQKFYAYEDLPEKVTLAAK
jgi:3',5'-cyclic AMP phosphodiesterase CpdA